MNDFESLEDAIKLLTDKRRALTGPDSHVVWLILDSAATRLKAAAQRTPLGRPEGRPPTQAPQRGAWGVEVQIYLEFEFLSGRRWPTRKLPLEKPMNGRRSISAAASLSREHATGTGRRVYQEDHKVKKRHSGRARVSACSWVAPAAHSPHNPPVACRGSLVAARSWTSHNARSSLGSCRGPSSTTTQESGEWATRHFPEHSLSLSLSYRQTPRTFQNTGQTYDFRSSA
jgi:hypothetical protein